LFTRCKNMNSQFISALFNNLIDVPHLFFHVLFKFPSVHITLEIKLEISIYIPILIAFPAVIIIQWTECLG